MYIYIIIDNIIAMESLRDMCRVLYSLYCKATIFSELLNLVKLAMTHETLNLLALNVRSKVTLYSSKSI